MNRYSTLLHISFEKNFQKKNSHLTIVPIIFATLFIFMIFQMSLIQTQTVSAQQQLLQVNQSYSNIKQQPNFQGLVFDIDGIPFSHHMASVNGIQMHYVMGGHGDPLVLLHGYPQSWYEWRYVMPFLAKNYTIVAPDLRGFGDSSKPLTGYDGNNTAEDIYQLMKQWGLQKSS